MLSESRSVPWTGTDVFLFFALWIAAQIVCGIVVGVVDVVNTHTQAPPVVTENADSSHPLAQMVEQSQNSLIVLLIAFLAAVVIVPIVEEFLFRMLLQGWLESKLARFQVPCFSGVTIVAVSFCFAVIHGGNSGSHNTQALTLLFGTVIVTNILILAFGIFYLKQRRQVQIIRYLLGDGKFFPPQFFTYAGWCLATFVLLFGLTATLNAIYPNTNTSPIPIFFFSLLLGTIFSKTQNLSYCILLHACLNGTSLSLLWLLTN